MPYGADAQSPVPRSGWADPPIRRRWACRRHRIGTPTPALFHPRAQDPEPGMVMVNQPAARHHRSRIAYAFGVLALLGAVTTLVVLVRDPALSSTRLAAPVPAPEITVVDADPPADDEPWTSTDAPDDRVGATDPTGPATGAGAGAGAQSDGQPDIAEAGPSGHPATDVRRSLLWSGIFGLTIALAGLGLVGTRRRMW